MDHFPSITYQKHPPVLIRISNGIRYDRRGFTEFPDRCGLSKERFDHCDFTNNGTKSQAETQGVLYSWLYFGLIYEIFGDVMKHFLTSLRPGELIVTTRQLNRYLQTWYDRLVSLRDQDAARELKRLEVFLGEVTEIVRWHLQPGHVCEWPLTEEMSLSILLLLESLDSARLSVCRAIRRPTKGLAHLGDIQLKSFEQAMIADGWCPNQVNMFRSKFGLSTLYFASRFDRPFQRTHGKNCKEDQCVAYEVDLDESRINHATPGCDCTFVYSPMAVVSEMVKKGEIPLLELIRKRDQSIHIQALRYRPQMKYIAVSHVWSHGMGHDQGNFLPRCHVDRVIDFVAGMKDSADFLWLDMFCVPRQPPWLRQLGIQQIKKTYEEASSTLVLDEELLQSRYCFESWEEALIRINLSGWMRRLWTLHEAVRSKRMSFQFANGAVDLEDLTRRISSPMSGMFNVVGQRAVSALEETSTLCKEQDGHVRMARLWTLMRWRLTSWVQDETICMMNMLDVRREIVYDFATTPDFLRLKRFLLLYDQYPAELIYIPGPRLTETGWAWSPASWLVRRFTNMEQQELETTSVRPAIRISKGLVVKYPGILAHHTLQSLGLSFPHYYLQGGHSGSLLKVTIAEPCTSWHRRWHDLQASKFAICVQEEQEELSTDKRRIGALLALTNRQIPNQDELLYGMMICVVQITHVSGPRCTRLEGEEGQIGREPILRANFVQQPRLWCIR